MTQITVKEFAELHEVDPSAIRHAIKAGRIKSKKKAGIHFVSSTQKYNPHTRGVKPKKKSTRGSK